MATLPSVDPGPPPPDPEQDPDLRPSTLPQIVVGLGASAGGLQALTRFFEKLPADSGMSYVVVMHLLPSQPSHAAAILQRCASIPVDEVTDAVALEPDHVYVIPPGQSLWLSDGRLHLRQAAHVDGRNIAIDAFFRVLAQVHGNKAIGIVFSGTGSDGSVGIKRVKELGGVTMAQSPEDAEQPGMPRAAIATGMVDFVLPAGAMPARLLQIAASLASIRLPADIAGELEVQEPTSADESRRTEAALADVMLLLRRRTQHDFRHYKRPTVLRRLERRMQVTGQPTLEAYREFLKAHPEETAALLQDMLISVTNFFRDRDAFDALAASELPALYARASPERGLRAWVVGCATGEEAYSLAMLLQEERDRQQHALPFQVFASDIDERALGIARAGLYPDAIASDVPLPRLREYFRREGDSLRIIKRLRERVLFAHHNVLSDPPFSRVDIICCRNLLIYLDRSAQAAVLESFRYALRPGGLLFLGFSESAEGASNAFEAVDKRHRIYRLGGLDLAARLSAVPPAMPAPGEVAGLSAGPRPASPAELHQRAALAWAPPSVLLDPQHRILHLSGDVSRFLQIQPGSPSHHLVDNVRPSLRLDLRSALFRARPPGPGELPLPVVVETEDSEGRVRISVKALRDPVEGLELRLVVFEALPRSPAASPAIELPAGVDAQALQSLADENTRLQRQLQEVIEHSEASTGELMSSNEELQAVNEELRSATEELETSREELQSTNEELTTVNSQLALKVEEAVRVTDDLENLINANDIASVFIDRGMRIKRYTPRAVELFSLIAGDVGRSLTDITHLLAYPEMVQDAHTAFQTLRLIEREVSSLDGERHFVARVLPYRTGNDRIDGAIVSFVDVSALRRSQRESRASAEQLRLAAESTRDFAIIALDRKGIVTAWNTGAARLFGFSEAEMLGQDIAVIFTDEDRAAAAPEREREEARTSGRAEDERWHRRKDGSVFYCSGVMTRLDDGHGFAKIARDLTGSQRAALARERQLSHEQAGRRQAEATMEAKELFLAVMSHELKHPLNLIHLNAELLARLPEIRQVPAATRAADVIRQTVAGQARIIDDLLDLSRARTSKLRLDLAPVDWTALVRRIVDATRAEAQHKGVRIHFQPGTRALVSQFDALRAEQVVWNLLNNALKFTPGGGSIRVALAADGDFARLTVTDTGVGIAPDFLDQVFEMFSQQGGPVRDGEEGLGIGLALVRELVQAQGGRVQARSEGLGRGAELSVWVPLLHDVPAPAPAPPTVSVLQGLQVLVVDDSADSAETFALLLQLAGAKVSAAHSGAQALERLAAAPFDLLISDVSMPGMSGHELIRQVRAKSEGSPGHGLMALACSGYSRAQDRQRAIEAGFDALIGKPASLEQVEKAVQALRERDAS